MTVSTAAQTADVISFQSLAAATTFVESQDHHEDAGLSRCPQRNEAFSPELSV
jgi:hypothetical protein